jgi:hypothetical protein
MEEISRKNMRADLWVRSQWNILWEPMGEVSKENTQGGVII